MENVQEIARGETDTTSFFKILKDGNGTQIKVINLDNPKVCKRSGLIELVPLRQRKNTQGNVIHNTHVMFKRFIDKDTKTSVGIIEGIDPKSKEFKYRMITLDGYRIYDLSDINDAQEWACIKLCPYLEGSPNQDRTSPPLYKVYDKEKQAEDNLAKVKTKRKAEQIADTLTGDLLDDMLKVCGISTIGMSEVVKQYAIIQFAETNSETFLKHFESPTRHESFLLKQAVDMDIVQHDLNVGFVYRTQLLGLNEQLAIEFLRSNPNTSIAIETLVAMKKDETAKSNIVEKPHDPEAELKAAQDEVAKLRAQLASKATKSAEDELGKSLEGDGPDPEFETLKAKAKHLGIPKWHLLGKEKLEAAIKAKENEA